MSAQREVRYVKRIETFGRVNEGKEYPDEEVLLEFSAGGEEEKVLAERRALATTPASVEGIVGYSFLLINDDVENEDATCGDVVLAYVEDS